MAMSTERASRVVTFDPLNPGFAGVGVDFHVVMALATDIHVRICMQISG